MKTNWTTANIPSQVGRRALITGSNSGIGFEAALALARRGAEVILPARTQAKADDAAARILEQVPSAQLYPEILDLAVQASVHAFANRMIERFPGQSLDLLINNAGVMALPTREITGDGFERQFATNYLGPFALTGLLLPSMKQRAGSRVVTVSSAASNQGKIEFDNLQGERVYKPFPGVCAIEAGRPYFRAGVATAAEGSRVSHSEHSRTSRIRSDQSAGGSFGTVDENDVGSDEAVPFARCCARGITNAVCGGCRGSSRRRLLRPGRLHGGEGVSDGCADSEKCAGRNGCEAALARI